MSMIKRGSSENSKPSVVSSTYRCVNCGHLDKVSSTCPKCEGRMVESVISTEAAEGCKNGTCKIR